MSWSEIKSTPNVELQGLLAAFSNYNTIHAFDGYDSDDVNRMAKDKPLVREQYRKANTMKEKFQSRVGVKKRKVVKTLSDILN